MLLDFLSSFPESNTDPVLQIVGARLLPFTPIPVRSESRPKALKSLLAVLTTHTPVLAYVITPLTNTLRESHHTMFSCQKGTFHLYKLVILRILITCI